ncbi:hypothetical protein VBY74_13360 [Tenacibaculum ascidiaceicola]|uniref:hypothetical protein n=1 Tax=Tenacibaculum ascidiaceicola TaxID=1699411 RepID=UPI0039E741B1
MRNKIFTLILLVFIVGCKKQEKKSIEKKDEIITENYDVSTTEVTPKEYDLDQLQGIWRSFSYYLEHEQDDKDEHKNEYYKVVSKSKCLDIILREHEMDSILYKTYELGFIDNKNQYKKGMEKPPLKTKGSFLVRNLTSVFQKGEGTQKFIEEFEVSQNIQRYYDTYELLDDGFNYKNFGVVEKVQFKKVLVLPVEVYKKLKEFSAVEVEAFNIAELSSMVVVNVPKSYFYEDENLEVKKRAFLIQNDKAYLEEINDNSVKVYYDGVKITSGYLKKSEVTILQD